MKYKKPLYEVRSKSNNSVAFIWVLFTLGNWNFDSWNMFLFALQKQKISLLAYHILGKNCVSNCLLYSTHSHIVIWSFSAFWRTLKAKKLASYSLICSLIIGFPRNLERIHSRSKKNPNFLLHKIYYINRNGLKKVRNWQLTFW